jgi:hypothetical protein
VAPKNQEPPKSEFSDSDRAKLDEFLRDRDFKTELAKRRKAKIESVKAWSIWITALSGAWLVIWDKLIPAISEWLSKHFH